MGTNYTATSIGSGVAQQTTINAEWAAIQAALERMLNIYGDSTNGANAMQDALDMNNKKILNVPAPILITDLVRLGDLSTADAADALTTILTDAGGNYTSDNVEGAMTEIAASLNALAAGSPIFTIAGGTVDIITATLTPAIAAYTDGLQINLRAVGATTIASPTLNINSVGGKTITKLGNEALRAGDIPKAGYECIFRYNLATDVFELINPALYPPLAGETGVVNYEYEWGNVKRYGALGDWDVATETGTDDSDAIIAAINAALQSATVLTYDSIELFFPGGKYRVTKTVFSAFTATFQLGLHCKGEGWWSSMIVVDPPSAADVWLFDNGANAKIQHMTFADMGFMGRIPSSVTPVNAAYADINQYTKLFKITAATGSLHEKGFNFTRCNFLCCSQAFQFEGDNIASEMKFSQCRFNRIRDAMYTVNNVLSINHEFYGTDAEVLWGDVFVIGTEGGGNVKTYGGSWIMSSDDQTSPVDRFLVKFNSGSSFNNVAAPFVFTGMAMELRGTYSKLYQCVDVLSTMVTFRDARFLNTSVAVKNVVEMTRGNYMLFDGCNFSRNDIADYETFTIDSTAMGGSVGEIVFEKTLWPEPTTAGVVDKTLAEAIIFDGNYGIARGRGNFGRQGAVFTDHPLIIAQDFDMNSPSSQNSQYSQTSPHRPLKTVTMMNATTFPNAGGTARERTVKLPPNAIIKNIHIRKLAAGATVDTYQLHVGTNDKITTHGSSTSAQIKDEHSIDLTDQFIDVGTADNDRIIRMWATGTTNTEVQTSGHAIIEYY